MDSTTKRVPLEIERSILDPEPAHGSRAPSLPQPPPATPSVPGGAIDVNDIEEKVIAALQTCYDPEIPVNIYELGLIYDIDVDASGAVQIKMTLTSPACPVAGSLPPEVQAKVSAIPGVTSAKVDLVWDPPWNQDRMSEAARLQLGFF
jgi:FeS assembly SUF system protein